MSVAYQFRWILPDATTTEDRRLQYRSITLTESYGSKSPKPGPWVTIPLVVVSPKEFDESAP